MWLASDQGQGIFLPVERKPYPGQNLLDNHNRWNENDPAFFSTIYAHAASGALGIELCFGQAQ
jgi:hypothetical protein